MALAAFGISDILLFKAHALAHVWTFFKEWDWVGAGVVGAELRPKRFRNFSACDCTFSTGSGEGRC